MKLTIGMATVEDFDGVYFTIQSLRIHHQLKGVETEFIVVDNRPTSRSSPHVKNFLNNIGGKYVPMPEPPGTTQTRNRVFQEATGEYVLCVDSHILLMEGALENLINFYIANPHTSDLISGPLVYDGLNVINTHFDDVWRAEMWGIWGRAWGCSGKVKTPWDNEPTNSLAKVYISQEEISDKAWHTPCPAVFTFLDVNGVKVPHTLSMNPQPCPTDDRDRYYCPTCHYTFPKEEPSAWANDLANGSQPFEIPGQGLGLFSCRREAWLGFNPHFTYFGGEEMYIHEKYRQAGHKAICLPKLKWVHRFGRPNNPPYVFTSYHKVRNYVLGHKELNLPLDRIHEHFVKKGPVPQEQWDFIVENPIEAGRVKVVVTGLPQPRASLEKVEEFLAWVEETPRDLNEHVKKLYELSSQVDHVTELSHRRESTVGLLGAKQKLISYNAENDVLLHRLVSLFPKLQLTTYALNNPLPDIEPTDLLFLDTIHTAPRLYSELKKYHERVSRWIVMHDTDLFKEKGENDQPGLLVALRRFMKEHPEWSVIYHTTKQHGLTVIGKQQQDKPQLPSMVEMAVNFTSFLGKYAASGAEMLPKEQVEQRLEICTPCEHRNNNRCAVCGCGLDSKAAAKVSECPIGKWPQVK